jgi:hypothetical protein
LDATFIRPDPCRAIARADTAGFVQRVERDVVGVGECGLVVDHRAHAHALLDVEAAALDDAFLERERLGTRVLEVQVGVVRAVLEDRSQRPLQLRLVEPVRVEQQLLGNGKAVESGIEWLHQYFLGIHGVPGNKGQERG